MMLTDATAEAHHVDCGRDAFALKSIVCEPRRKARHSANAQVALLNARVVLDWHEQYAITKSDETPKLRQVQALRDYEEVLVTGAAPGSDNPPEQAQNDFHKWVKDE
jgi:hypothetical protein